MVKEPVRVQKAFRSEWGGPYRFSVEQYRKIGELGIIPPDVKTELIDGYIIPMSIGKDHAAVVKRLNRKISRKLPEEAATISVQDPLTIDDGSEPLPDVMVLDYRSDDYAAGLPMPSNVKLLIEVSDSSLKYDREDKLPKYARNAVVETWIVDLAGQKVWVHLQPSLDGYLQIQAYERGAKLRAQGLDLELGVDEILG
jgi:Uma2 family endonuclease